MNDIFDKNLSLDNVTFNEDFSFYDVTNPPFRIYGNAAMDFPYRRLPQEIADAVSPGVSDRAQMSAGIRLRFKTNSKKLGIKVAFIKSDVGATQSALSARGFDIYTDGRYCTSLRPTVNSEKYYEQLADIGNGEEKDVTLYFPYYAVIERVKIALEKNSYVLEADSYSGSAPLVFYGSSITHGFCTSRPGNAYPAMISRRLNMDFVNLGFSGVCRGEALMADYIASFEKSAVICEYDHNEPDAHSLQKNHLSFYKRLRAKDALTPIIFLSSPNKFYRGECMLERMRIVEATYEYALKNGDNNTYFLNGQLFYPDDLRDECMADHVHPNDLGAYMIANKIFQKLKCII